jgi:hypothetical protein
VGSVDPPITGRIAIAELYDSKVFNVPGHRADLLGRLIARTRSWITSVSSVSLLSHSRRLRSTR